MKPQDHSIRRTNQQQTKHKVPVPLPPKNLIIQQLNQKPTMKIKNKMANQLAEKLISQTAILSEQSSKSEQESSSQVCQIDELYVQGTIKNYGPLDIQTKKKHNITQKANKFEVQNYLVIFVGKHGFEPKDGMNVGLYAPPAFKSVRDPITQMITVIIHRKVFDQCHDPLQYPYFVIDPDNYLYPTYLCSWLQCKRRITIMHYIEYTETSKQQMVYGNAIHLYLQWIIKKQVEATDPGQNQMRKLYNNFLYEMYLLNNEYQGFVERCRKSIENIVKWYQTHIIKGELIVIDKWEQKFLKIERVLASEYAVKSKYFGIKGKIDALFEGTLIYQKANQKIKVSVPFQLKTGKCKYHSHLKQTDLYVLLIREQRLLPVVGLLFYSEEMECDSRMQNPLASFQYVNVHRNRIIINQLNLFEEQKIITMPKLSEILNQCQKCDSAVQCGVLRKQLKDLEDLHNEITEQTPEKYHQNIREKLLSISVLDFQYMKKWLRLIHMEEFEERKGMKNSRNRKIFHHLEISLDELQKLEQHKGEGCLRLKIKKSIGNQEIAEMTDSYLKVGQKIKVYIPLIKLMENCRICNIEKKSKTYVFNVEIRNKEICFNRRKLGFLLEERHYQEISVNFEKYENTFFNQMRGFAFKFALNAPTWLKNIVIDQNYQSQQVSNQFKQYSEKISHLNKDQQEAFIKSISPNKFTLIEGMPGTGKTQLILELIQYFYAQQQTVLVTSFTNQALSNIMERELKRKRIPETAMIRDGSKFSISPDQQKMTIWGQQFSSVSDYKQFFRAKKIWFVTISSLYLSHIPQQFDVVIIDEASQCLEPICLQAILKSNKFMMIGDERQLQPVVKSASSKQEGMSISLFERLCKKYPEYKVTLKKQYRMNRSIMNLSNKLVYDGQLEVADDKQNDRILQLHSNWSQSVPKCFHPIIAPGFPIRFINYDQSLNLISKQNKSYYKVKKLIEIKLVSFIYKFYRSIGIDREDILIISAYNILVSEIVKILKKEQLIDQNKGDVLTIDRSQGTDKQIIIFLFQKGNKELTENPRRLNVALTRAKNKFIIIGSLKELKQIQVWTGELAKMLYHDQIETSSEIIQKLFQD